MWTATRLSILLLAGIAIQCHTAAVYADNGNTSVEGRITVDGKMTQYTLPQSVDSVRNLALAPDGNLWFTDDAGQVREVFLRGVQ